MTNPAIDQLTISAVVVMMVQWLKNTKWIPFMQAHTDTVNRVVAWGAAAGTALGLHLAYDSTTHTLTLTGLAFATFVHGGWDWIKSVAVQELIYKGVLKPGAVSAAPPPAA